MPVTITVPGGAAILGPGLGFQAQSDFIGPLPTGSFWQAFWYQTSDLEHDALAMQIPATTTLLQMAPYATKALTPGSTSEAQLYNGSDVTMQLNLMQDATVELDTGQFSGKWDTESGQALVTVQNSGGGGLTSDEATQLQNIWTWVQQQFTIATGDLLSTPIGSLIAHPPLTAICPDGGGPGVLTGRGQLTRPGFGFGVNAYGLYISALTVPAGFGERQGALLEYYARIAQFVPLHPVSGSSALWPTEVFDFNTSGQLWLWRDMFPSAILYDVTPGCAVQANWAILCGS